MKTTIELKDFITGFSRVFPEHILKSPWSITKNLEAIILNKIQQCGPDYVINGNIAIHKTATVEEGVVMKGPLLISENCFVAAHAYLRAGVFLDRNVIVGPGCELKSSLFFEKTTVAHFNFIGDSLVGSKVNMEAGSIVANHHNDRDEKEIFVMINGTALATGSQKFGALIGDSVKIGANAVLSPGTILEPNSVVGRLELVKQS